MLAGFANWLMRQAKGVWGLVLRALGQVQCALGRLFSIARQRKAAAVLSALAVIILIGAVQAGGPMGRPFPHKGGMRGWHGWRWWPPQPVPMMTITAVEEDVSVSFTTKNLPEDEDFQVLIGKMGTRGVNGTPVGSFNSSDGVDERIYRIPPEVRGDHRIAIRITTDHPWPYYAFNWFYNNTTHGTSSSSGSSTVSDEVEATEIEGSAEEIGDSESESSEGEETVEQTVLADSEEMRKRPKEEVPSFIICAVEKDDAILVRLKDFPANETFKVQMGVMPAAPAAEPYYDGKMQWMDKEQTLIKGRPMPPMPPEKEKSMDPPLHWIPYYDAGMLEIGRQTQEFAEFKIPRQLSGAYRISILMRTRHAYPYYAYNWFYNNDANVCFVTNNEHPGGNGHSNGDG